MPHAWKDGRYTAVAYWNGNWWVVCWCLLRARLLCATCMCAPARWPPPCFRAAAQPYPPKCMQCAALRRHRLTPSCAPRPLAACRYATDAFKDRNGLLGDSMSCSRINNRINNGH